jgi:hypothetical protein
VLLHPVRPFFSHHFNSCRSSESVLHQLASGRLQLCGMICLQGVNVQIKQYCTVHLLDGPLTPRADRDSFMTTMNRAMKGLELCASARSSSYGIAFKKDPALDSLRPFLLCWLDYIFARLWPKNSVLKVVIELRRGLRQEICTVLGMYFISDKGSRPIALLSVSEQGFHDRCRSVYAAAL